MDDQNTSSVPVDDASTPPAEAPEPAPATVDPAPLESNDSAPTDMPPIAPESPINAPSDTPVEDQNPPINQSFDTGASQDLRPESEGAETVPVNDQPTTPEASEPTPNTSQEPNSELPTLPASEPVQSQPRPTSEPIQPSPAQSDSQSISATSPSLTPASSSTSINESPTSEPVESLDQLQPNHSSPDQSGFIRGLLVKAQAKIQSNRQKKLDKVIELAQKKGTISNEDIQKSLHMPDRTATRYLVKLVEEGRLVRVGSPRDAKYRFLH